MTTDYTNVATLKTYLQISGAADDTLLADLVTRASRLVDEHTRRHFYTVEETRYYDAKGSHITGNMLLVDADLLEVSEVVNGDGEVLTPSDFRLRPLNWAPYFGIALKPAGNKRWTYSDDPEGAISVTGTWGYGQAVPPIVTHATIRLAAWLYRQRDTGAEPQQVEVNERGVASSPPRLPRDVTDMLGPFIRVKIIAA